MSVKTMRYSHEKIVIAQKKRKTRVKELCLLQSSSITHAHIVVVPVDLAGAHDLLV